MSTRDELKVFPVGASLLKQDILYLAGSEPFAVGCNELTRNYHALEHRVRHQNCCQGGADGADTDAESRDSF